MAARPSSAPGTPRSIRLSRADLESIMPLVLVIAATVLMLQANRVFVATMVFVIDQSERTELAFNAAITYALGAIAILLVRLLGGRATLLIGGIILSLSALGIQFLDDPTARFRIGQLAVVAWAWLLLPLLGDRRVTTAHGLVLAFVLDLGIRHGAGTIDLPWMPTGMRSAVLVLLVAITLAALWRATMSGPVPVSTGTAIGALAIGPAVGLYHLVTGNLGLSVVHGDLSATVMPWVLIFGTVTAIAFRPPATAATSGSLVGYAIGLALLAGGALWLVWESGTGAGIAFGVVAALASALLLLALTAGDLPASPARPGATGLWLTAGLLAETAIIFQYYQMTGAPLLTGALIAIILVAAVGAVRSGAPTPNATRPIRLATMAVAGCVLIAAIFAPAATLTESSGTALPREITVMTYNIQSGFSKDDHWDLEATARTIERENPDIVLLQEVSRGWLVTTMVDQLTWLAERLEMNVVWGPSSHDGLWGLAILSRGPILEWSMVKYAQTANLHRGALSARIATDGGDLWVICTHLDNPGDEDAVRLLQQQELIAAWGGKTPIIIGGDFNADPNTAVTNAMLDAGFRDAGGSVANPATTSDDDRRIDYVYFQGPLELRDATVPDVWTSDHRPVVAKFIVTG